jgi:hypothetical protein
MVAAAEEQKVSDGGVPAVFAVGEVVGVAHRDRSGAAAGGAALVAAGQGPALGGGDLVGQ